MALLMVELTRRDLEYGDWCHDDWYDSDVADHMRQDPYYETNLEFVRRMLRRHDARKREEAA